MIKCNNCSQPAAYQTDNPSARPQHFCKSCLPWHLKKRADLGLLVNPNAEAEPEAQPEESSTPKRKRKVADLTASELVEEAPAEEPAPESPVEE